MNLASLKGIFSSKRGLTAKLLTFNLLRFCLFDSFIFVFFDDRFDLIDIFRLEVRLSRVHPIFALQFDFELFWVQHVDLRFVRFPLSDAVGLWLFKVLHF